MSISTVLEAPLALGEEVGTIQITYQGQPILDAPIVVTSEVEKSGFFSGLWDSIILFVMGMFGKI